MKNLLPDRCVQLDGNIVLILWNIAKFKLIEDFKIIECVITSN